MASHEVAHRAKKMIWGVFLMTLGVVFLLERLGTPGFTHLDTWWPLILVVVGITSLVEGRVGSALTMMLLAAWFFVVTNHWHGLTYANSWPLVLVAVGVGMVLKALSREDQQGRRTEGGAS
jgi:hypothetical protein